MDNRSFCNVCGGRCRGQTSWTDLNPGRRYVRCPNNECRNFAWIDPPMCARSVQIIPGLLRRINRAEAEVQALKIEEKKLLEKNEAMKSREKKMWIILSVGVIWIGIFLF